MTRPQPFQLTRLLASALALTCLSACGFPGSKLYDYTTTDAQYLIEELPTGRSLHAYSVGDEDLRPIIFVHGTPGTAEGWDRYLQEPEPGARMIAIDRLGFGRSRRGGVVRNIDDQADSLRSLLREDTPPAILVGHSLGGPIVAWAAAEYPKGIAGIVIVAGALDPDLERVHFMQWVAELFPMPLLLPNWAVTSNRELIALEDKLRELRPMLADIRMPVAIIHGTRDKLVPYENVPFMIEHIDSAPVRVFKIEKGNHFVPWNSEATVREAIAWVRAQASAQETRHETSDLPG